MMQRGIIIAALALYIGVGIGCLFHRSNAADPASITRPSKWGANIPGAPFRGVAMQIQRVDWMDKYKKSMDEVAALGADTVLLVVEGRQENGTSNIIYLDMRLTPTPDGLSDLIDHAKKLKLRVVLMPIVLLDAPRGNEWRGTLDPASWGEWFDSYRAMVKHFAYIAKGHGVDVMVVGSELVSSQNKVDEWRKTIREIREIVGEDMYLTYSANWDDYWNVQFWDELDMIGMNSYWTMGEKPTGDHATTTVDEIIGRWREIQNGHGKIPSLLGNQEKLGKPILFLEAGWFSQRNTAYEPWDYTKEGEPVDLELQKRLYEAFFRSWYGNPALAGFMIWEWPPSDGGPEDRGYTPKNKPAEKVLREWLRKPWGNNATPSTTKKAATTTKH